MVNSLFLIFYYVLANACRLHACAGVRARAVVVVVFGRVLGVLHVCLRDVLGVLRVCVCGVLIPTPACSLPLSFSLSRLL